MRNLVGLLISLFFIFNLSACTQESVVKNTALRHVVLKFDDDLNKNTDAQAVAEIKKKTQIEVSDIKMLSDKEANATVTIKSVNPQNRTEPTTQTVTLHLLKDSVWSVQ